MKRRTFLKMAGMGSVAFAAGCSSESDKTIYSLVNSPDDMVTGKASWYASVCRECPAGCGILVKNYEGRAVKIEGNPLHPVNKGRLCMRGQAALQGVYHPDRLLRPKVKAGDRWREIGFAEAQALLEEKAAFAVKAGPDRVRLVTEMIGESLFSLFSDALARWHSGPPIIFEPLAPDTLKAAHTAVFGQPDIPAYRLEKADLIISLGADILETWLSPVSYARQFKAMHAFSEGKKGRFFHIDPFQSLTGANADTWICCRPGTESIVALGLLRESLLMGKGASFSEAFGTALKNSTDAFSPESVCKICDIRSDNFKRLLEALKSARAPLVLGTHGRTATPAADITADLVNWALDPKLSLLDFHHAHRISAAASREAFIAFCDSLRRNPPALLLLNRVNPVYALPSDLGISETLEREDIYVVSFTDVMDDTDRLADLVIPVRHSLESWDEFAGQRGFLGLLQPTMPPLTVATGIGDLLLQTAFPDTCPATDYKGYIQSRFFSAGLIKNRQDWVEAVRQGGVFRGVNETAPIAPALKLNEQAVLDALSGVTSPKRSADTDHLTLLSAPSIRFFDGRGGNKPWLCEAPDPLTQVTWQTPVLAHPETLQKYGIEHESVIRIKSAASEVTAIVYETEGVHPSALVMGMGQGHRQYSRYASDIGVNPIRLFSIAAEMGGGEPSTCAVTITLTGKRAALAHTDGSRIQHGRKIALHTPFPLSGPAGHDHGKPPGLSMNDFPLTLPLPEGYSKTRDFYPPHDHAEYRWSMVVDLDRCIGCGACAVACYAENNIGVVGEERIRQGREMAWLQIQRYHDMDDPSRIIFLPMMCQHCDNAPCEAVCPVYAPHHSKEGLNNQVYNRCIGTRFCSQNCPYKVRRFNWFDWKWLSPLEKQLNPHVTVRSKGVMEKCSFCVQRIKEAHGWAKNEDRMIRDGEVVPACVQTCPTDALIFGNLMDPKSRVRQLVNDRRAYQVMGYLNTKPAVIYLKKVVHV